MSVLFAALFFAVDARHHNHRSEKKIISNLSLDIKWCSLVSSLNLKSLMMFFYLYLVSMKKYCHQDTLEFIAPSFYCVTDLSLSVSLSFSYPLWFQRQWKCPVNLTWCKYTFGVIYFFGGKFTQEIDPSLVLLMLGTLWTSLYPYLFMAMDVQQSVRFVSSFLSIQVTFCFFFSLFFLKQREIFLVSWNRYKPLPIPFVYLFHS